MVKISLNQIPSYQEYKAIEHRPEWLGKWPMDDDGEYLLGPGELMCRAMINGRLCATTKAFSCVKTLKMHVGRHDGVKFKAPAQGDMSIRSADETAGYYNKMSKHRQAMEGKGQGDDGFEMFLEHPVIRIRPQAARAIPPLPGPLDADDADDDNGDDDDGDDDDEEDDDDAAITKYQAYFDADLGMKFEHPALPKEGVTFEQLHLLQAKRRNKILDDLDRAAAQERGQLGASIAAKATVKQEVVSTDDDDDSEDDELPEKCKGPEKSQGHKRHGEKGPAKASKKPKTEN
ncbi:Uu.00g140030.m01.CDS01 [Anthostomella pinea]|uniref:Uu.00g140030.m01.CDS01 n=1 Tax=Anthostomella pinea TaxID=933095 RepID=A0AAI8VQ19_9PEZI|nr:Uu.00g140030.m01.CDS01 [Anthostomella pinea]